jgi:hypothetical protein
MKKNENVVRRDGQRGQTLAMVALMLPILLGMAALVVDLGYIYVSYEQLVAATQAAALAGGGAITNTSGPTATTFVLDYSALGTYGNKHPNLKNVSLSVSLACVSPSSYPGLNLPPCALYPSCPSGCNMIQVQSSAQVSTLFAKILGYKTVNFSASAVASAKGGQVPPYHIMMLLDATGSMGTGTDTGCTQNGVSVTPEQCAEYGAQTLLSGLDPCSVALTTCTLSSTPGTVLNADDQVGIMIFPGLCSNTGASETWQNCPTLAAGSTLTDTISNSTYASDEYSCPPTTSSKIPYASYNNNPEYMILGFQSNYRFSDSSGLNTGSNIFKTVGVGTNNCGIAPDTAHYDTFYAGVIQSAQDYLTQNTTTGVQNIIIILSDGDANTVANNPCTAGGQADMCGNVAQVDGPCAAGTSPCGPGNSGVVTGVYPPLDDCEQAVQAATYAKSLGTLIYSVSYGSETTGCRADQTSYSWKPATTTYKGDGNYPTPCSTMQGMSSLPLSQYFFSVPNSAQAGGTICSNAVPITSLNQVFTTIQGELTVSRLVPQGDF